MKAALVFLAKPSLSDTEHTLPVPGVLGGQTRQALRTHGQESCQGREGLGGLWAASDSAGHRLRVLRTSRGFSAGSSNISIRC